MRTAPTLLVLAASLLCAPVAMALSEYGIEGMGVVSTKAAEGRASVSPDGQRIVFASDRAGGAGGWDLWQASLREGRWQSAQPLALNTAHDDVDPYFSHDGRWLLFASDRDGHLVLYRAPVSAGGDVGAPERLPGEASDGAERSPALNAQGTWLLSSRQEGAGGWTLYAAPLRNGARGRALALTALDTAAHAYGADWLGTQGAVIFTRSEGTHAQVWQAACAFTGAEARPLALSFNTAEGFTGSPVVDAAKPTELLVSSRSARSPRAGATDVYRLVTPQVTAAPDCLPAAR